MPELTDQELTALTARAEAGDSAAAALEERGTALDIAHNDLNLAIDAENTSNAALLHVTRAAHPDIPADLITGGNAADIAASVDRGQVIADQARASAADNDGQPPKTTVPAGSPPRTKTTDAPDRVRGTSRIAYALTHPGPGSTEA